MTLKTTEFNPFDYMETQQEIEVFLQECLADDDPNTFIEALGLLVKKHGVSYISQASGLNRESLYKSFSGKTKPRWDTVFKVMKALNFNFTTHHAV
ncbi:MULTISPECIES: addiction module antidote protein [Idiomarina]|jgi:probable addiction module antidote protein|uniref:Transcriptional regulator n=1 Tax=Idiomarina zobellii TaxID=86103 RepID=A0A837NHA8_9GAMM|nr:MULTISPECIES: addiction module antidote protein [Idiomarina]KPD23635.1 transcriptional regulator [Idiomarina zobellii]SDF91731.1 probable addiction module antidote protein [Idiomarina zobellii]